MLPMFHIQTDDSSNIMIAPPKENIVPLKIDERPASNILPNRPNNDKRLNTQRELAVNIIGWTLQGGVIISAAVILLGVILLPFRPGGFSAHRLLAFPENLGAVWSGLLTLQP